MPALGHVIIFVVIAAAITPTTITAAAATAITTTAATAITTAATTAATSAREVAAAGPGPARRTQDTRISTSPTVDKVAVANQL